MKRVVVALFFFLFFFFSTVILSRPTAGNASEDRYLRVDGPCDFVFPRDHGDHPGYRVEWWYYTGNLTTDRGARYGFQLTFFRTQINPSHQEEVPPAVRSAWRTKQLYFAHTALSSIDDSQFDFDEKMARGAVGLAGVERSENSARVFLGPWSVLMEPGKHRLKAITERFGLDLVLIPTKPPVPHGIRGYSLKGSKPESASCYYSFTRLKAAGSVNMGGKSVLVNGTAWMDHEFSSAPLEENLTGWDWFSIQLEDRTELMIYLLRRKDNDYSGASSGTFITRSGKSLHLNKEDFQADVVDHWKSERSGAIYPLRWRIRVFPIKLDLTVVPNMADQELITERTTRVSYWEGSVSVNGHYVDRSIDGDGYVEMTGYAKPFMLLEQ
jgi:predicted secreted hydrolase